MASHKLKEIREREIDQKEGEQSLSYVMCSQTLTCIRITWRTWQNRLLVPTTEILT